MKFVSKLFAVSVLIVGIAIQPVGAANDRFMEVMEKGKIVIGVKADYKPWGFRNESGEIVGMEIDMAKDVADTIRRGA